MVRAEGMSSAIDELDDSDDMLDEEDEAPWEEPTHVTRKRARGRRGGKRAARPARDAGAFADFDGLCLLCTLSGHRTVDCTMGPVCMRCGETGHMARECALPRPPRPPSLPGGVEPARKRLNDNGRGRRMGAGAGDFRARAPEAR
jgi:hypothetical protein